jgi:hypothetical protein
VDGGEAQGGGVAQFGVGQVAEGLAVGLKEGWLVQLAVAAEGAVKGDEGAQVEAHGADADVVLADYLIRPGRSRCA